LGREERFVMRREISIGKRKRKGRHFGNRREICNEKRKFWEMKKQKKLERKNLTEKN
jgi:hypothetical protein